MRNSIILMVVAAATPAFASPVSISTTTSTSVAANPTSSNDLFPDGFTISAPDNEKTNTNNFVTTVTASTKEEMSSGTYTTEDDHIRDQADYEADVVEFEEEEQFFRLREAQRLRQEAEDLDPYYSEDTTDEEYPNQDEWMEYWDLDEKAEWIRRVEKRDGARKHGVACNIL